MDLVGWGMRITVIPREYATQEIAARVFGNRRASGGYASGGVAGLLANTAALSPEELNDNSSLVEEDPEIFGQSLQHCTGNWA